MGEEKKKILIVDDDTFLLDMYAFKFSQRNFEVYTAPDGLQSLNKIKEGVIPDVILMDIMMPGMDGFEALKRMQDESLCPNAVKIILSNRSQHGDIEQGKSLGVTGYIVKANSTPAEVVDQVAKVLEDRVVIPK